MTLGANYYAEIRVEWPTISGANFPDTALDTDGSGLIHQGEMALLEEDPTERRKLEQRFRDGVKSASS